MRVLLTNHHLDLLRGSEIFTYSFGKELKRRGIEVDVFTFEPGTVSARMGNVLSLDELTSRAPGYYDAAFVNHNTCLEAVRDLNIAQRIACTVHGIVPPQEQPVPGADVYVAISEEIQDFLAEKGYESIIIRNGIDIRRFIVKSPLGAKPEIVALLSNYEGAREVVEEASKLAGCGFIHIGVGDESIWDVENKINQADIVVTVGRGVLEALACGRNVIIYDNRTYYETGIGDGFFTPEQGLDMARNNYSGRRFKKEFDAGQLAQEFNKYDPSLRPDNREYVRQNHDIKKQVDRYLELVI